MLAWERREKRALKLFFLLLLLCADGGRSDSKDIEGKGYFMLLRLQS